MSYKKLADQYKNIAEQNAETIQKYLKITASQNEQIDTLVDHVLVLSKKLIDLGYNDLQPFYDQMATVKNGMGELPFDGEAQ